MSKQLVPQTIQSHIHLIRGLRVILSQDLARLYGVTTKQLNQQVRRNARRFPPDFMFQLTALEAASSRSQIVTLKKRKRGYNIKYRPLAFTEQGVAMLSSVLNSRRAVSVNIAIMRAFVRLREMINRHKDLAHKIDDLERTVDGHDGHIKNVFAILRRLVNPPRPRKRPIGFLARRSGAASRASSS